MKIARILLLLTLACTLMLGFNNCGRVQSLTNSLDKLNCSLPEMQSLFESGFHNFFTTNSCNSCHAPGGISGIPHFASSNTQSAFNAFSSIGPSKVIDKLKTNHQGYSFSQFQDQLESLRAEWNEEQGNVVCSKEGQFISSEKSLDLFYLEFTRNQVHENLIEVNPTDPFGLELHMPDWQVITWDITNVPGAQVQLGVKVDVRENRFPNFYRLNQIKIRSPKADLRVKAIHVYLNGDDYNVTTFKGVDVVVPRSDNFEPVNPFGADAIVDKGDTALDDYSSSDKWKIVIEAITAQ